MPTIWLDTFLNDDVAVGTQFLHGLMAGTDPLQNRFDRMTLMRTIVRIDAAYTVHDAGEGSQRLSIGIALTSQEAFNAGTVSDPGAEGDFPSRGWVWRSRYRVYGFAADQPAVSNRAIDLDLRSRRKLDNGVSFLVADNGAIEGVSSTIRLEGIIRQLWLVG